ncbi:MAG: dTDP-4-dehydrorhamnose 3,5-epimerase [Hyphomicrobiaceae bacterium]
MQTVSLEIPDVKLLTPTRHGDDRGFVSEVYNARTLDAAGVPSRFVQENHSYSKFAGTVRGLHFQRAQFSQAKLVRVLAGAILDVAVDLRRTSPTFGRHVSATLSADNWAQIYIPEGFAHGFCTLEPDTAVSYLMSTLYAPASDAGVLWDDPALSIAWPVSAADAILSPKDAKLPPLAALAPDLLF